MSRSNCRKHQRHKQSPGICSICLNEKLSQLISTPIINNSSSSSSQPTKSLSSSSSSDLSSLSSSSNPSLCSSSETNIGYSRKMDLSKGRKSIRVFKNVVGRQSRVLNKSRSMAFVAPRRRVDEDEDGKKIGVGVKRGFWSKLLPRTSKGLMHSKTMRERVTHQFIN